MNDTPDKTPEQAKHPRDAAAELLRLIEAESEQYSGQVMASSRVDALHARWNHSYAAAQVHALLYVGDQVKALVELHREAIAPSVIDFAATGPHIAHIGDPEVLDFNPDLVARRRAERGDGRLHPAACRCDPLCGALGRERQTTTVAGDAPDLDPEVVDALLTRAHERACAALAQVAER